jgi:hypothetical protein
MDDGDGKREKGGERNEVESTLLRGRESINVRHEGKSP